MKICAFTGHRKIEDGHRRNITPLLARAIEFAYESGCRLFLTGGALGFDTLAAREVIRFKLSHPDVKLSIVLPCKDQSRMWSQSQVDSYEYTLSNADEVEYVSDEYSSSCMRKRNIVLAERADLLIAYVERSYSGAAQTVRIASNLGKTIYNLYPTLESMSK